MDGSSDEADPADEGKQSLHFGNCELLPRMCVTCCVWCLCLT